MANISLSSFLSKGAGPYTVSANTPSPGQMTITDTASGNQFVVDVSSHELEVVSSNGPISGSSTPGNKLGVDYLNGDMYYVDSSGTWIKLPVAKQDRFFTVAAQPGNNAGFFPLSPPTGQTDPGHVHLEIYDDKLAWFTKDTSGLWLQTAATDVARSPATNISPAADNATGAVGTSTAYAREDHKHPAQGVSADANNSLTVGSDG
ncbi:MAG: hypothetical protein D6800_11870, partial [Candidatus Zixiibacteriota bacterium]